MALNTLTDQLVHDMQDLWSAETEIHRQLPSLREAANQEILCEVLGRYEEQVAQQIETLDKLIRDRQAAPDGKPCRAIAALAEANQYHLLPAKADPTVKDAALVGAVTRMQHYKLAGYRCLLTYALELDSPQEAEFFRRCLSAETQFLRRLAVAELLVVDDANR